MKNISIYRVICIGILITLITGVVQVVSSILFMKSLSIQQIIVSIISVITLVWAIFQAYKIWSVKGLNSGFRKFAISGIIIYIFNILFGIKSFIESVKNIGKKPADVIGPGFDTGISSLDSALDAAIISGLTGEPLGGDAVTTFAIIGIVSVVISIIGIILVYRMYNGLYDGTVEFVEENSEYIEDGGGKYRLLESVLPLRKFTKAAIIYLPIALIVITILVVIISGFIGEILSFALLFAVAIAILVIIIIFFVKLYKFSDEADKLLGNIMNEEE